MLGYVCKYTPMELFEAMDTEITRLEPSVTDFNHADTLMHANICSYTKAVHQGIRMVKIRNGWFQTCDFRVHGFK